MRLLSLLVLVVSSFAAAQEPWPQFRGPGGSGVAVGRLPSTWDAKTNIAWRTPIPGRGWSSPVVWGDRVFVTAVVNDKTLPSRPGLYISDLVGKLPEGAQVRKLLCLDFASGKLLWERTVDDRPAASPIHIKNSYATETPVTDGEHVWAMFGNHGVYCFDIKGTKLWSHALPVRKIRFGWGTAASPVLAGDMLLVPLDNEEKSELLALDIRTGETRWRATRPEEKANWATPLVWKNRVRTEIVTAGSHRVRSYDLDGNMLWEMKGMSTIAIPTPIASPDGDLAFVTSGYQFDPFRPLYAIRPGGKGDITLEPTQTSSETVAWVQRQAGTYHPTPLVYDGLLYMLYDKGFLACFEARTGKEIYSRQRIDPTGDKFTASPWAADGKIYCLSEEGDTYVIRAGPNYELLAKNPLGEMSLASPAASRGSILIRTAAHLYRISEKN
jgi:outer membrane protein assembly factor BamB